MRRWHHEAPAIVKGEPRGRWPLPGGAVLLVDDLVDSGWTLTFVTPYAPSAGFSIGGAMGRNKVIYGLTRHAIVVSSEFQKGGTWAGAVEALKAGWCPVFVRDGDGAPPGNRELLKREAAPLSEAGLTAIADLIVWLDEHVPKGARQQELLPTSVAGTKRPSPSAHPGQPKPKSADEQRS